MTLAGSWCGGTRMGMDGEGAVAVKGGEQVLLLLPC